MIILLTGLPGVGKGTQADLIVEKYGIKHLSTGNLFRALLKEDSELSREVKTYMESGNLVPDELTIKMVKEEINKPGYENGFLLDGFPRTVVQAKFLNQLLEEENLKLDFVINLFLDDATIEERLVNRLFCPTCQTTYHKIYNPPKVDGICDKDGTKLEQRDDDKIENVLHRLAVGKEETLPVIDFYGSEVDTIDVNNKSIDEVFTEIQKVIDND